MRIARKVLLVASLFASLLPVIFLQQSASAATLVVNRIDDPNPNGCTPNDCSLREAVIASNNRPGPDVIRLKDAFYQLARAGTGENQSLTGDLDVRKPVTIVGKGKTDTTVDGNGLDRVFHVIGGIDVTISSLGISGGSAATGEEGGALFNRGHLILKNTKIFENDSTEGGGGLMNLGRLVIRGSRLHNNDALQPGCCGGAVKNEGDLTIRGSRLDHNSAENCCGGAVYNADGGNLSVFGSRFDHNSTGPGCCGGAIYTEDEGSKVSVTRSRFIENDTGISCCGGALFNDQGSILIVTRSTFLRNSVGDCCGGAIEAEDLGTKTVIRRSKVIDTTTAACCGAIFVQNSRLTMTDSVVRGNSSLQEGGGLFVSTPAPVKLFNSTVSGNDTTGAGGGIYLMAGDMTIRNSTISGNETGSDGGGIYLRSTGSLDLLHVTISRNLATGAGGGIYDEGGSFDAIRSIIGANNPTDCILNSLDTGLNLDSDSTCFTGGAAIHAPPRLLALGPYGGPTPTHKPKSSSAAVDAAPGSVCPPPTRDQRHVKRPRDGDGNGSKRCDLGSVER